MRPLLAPSQTPSNYPDFWKKLKYPLLGSPKLDGIRCIVDGQGHTRSRTWKFIPSLQVATMFGDVPWLDGELIEGNWTDYNVYNRTNSHVMSENKPGDMRFYVFDYAHPE